MHQNDREIIANDIATKMNKASNSQEAMVYSRIARAVNRCCQLLRDDKFTAKERDTIIGVIQSFHQEDMPHTDIPVNESINIVNAVFEGSLTKEFSRPIKTLQPQTIPTKTSNTPTKTLIPAPQAVQAVQIEEQTEPNKQTTAEPVEEEEKTSSDDYNSLGSLFASAERSVGKSNAQSVHADTEKHAIPEEIKDIVKADKKKSKGIEDYFGR